MNGQGHALLGISASGNAQNASTAAAFRAVGDTAGLLQSPVITAAGVANYNPGAFAGTSVTRWGDYSHTSVDPADGMSVWTFQMYAPSTTQWGVRVTRLKAPAPTVTSASPSSATQGQTLNVTITGTGLFDGGATFPNRLTAAVSGTGVTVNSVTFTNDTTAVVNLTIAAGATTGSRTLTMTNPDGQSASTTFTVNTAGNTVTGHVTLSNYSGTVTGLPITVEFFNGATLVDTKNTTLDASGNYSVTTTIANGTYNVKVKASHWLKKQLTGITLSGGTVSGVSPTLTNGDSTGDNVVDANDFSAVRAAFGSSVGGGTYNVNADLNGDGVVDATDFSICRGSFGQAGD